MRHLDDRIEIRGECRDIPKRHLLHFAVAHFRLDGDQPGRGFELEPRHRFHGLQHAGLDQHGDYANGVGAGHRRIFRLLHDHKAGVGFGMVRGQNQVAVRGRIAPRLAQHAQANVVGMGAQVLHFIEHGPARDGQHSAGNHAPRLAARVGIHRRDHA